MLRRLVSPALIAFSFLAGPAAAQDVTLGVAAPLSGTRAVLGAQILSGAREAASGVDLLEADTECTADGGAAAARRLVTEDADIAVGFLCAAALERALPMLTAAGIPTIVVGVRADRITDTRARTKFDAWRLGPRSDAEADALASFVAESWRGESFGIVEDGSAYARDLADEVRARLSEQTIEPALVDNFRPAEDRQFAIARRILQSGVTRVLLLGTRRDTAIVARDAAELDLDLEIVGGESLLDEAAPDVDIPAGVRAVGLAETAVLAEGGAREGYHPAAQAAAEIAVAAVRQAREDGRSLAQVLADGAFETNLGTIGFDEKGDSDWRAFGLLVFDGARFVPSPQS